LRVIDLESAAKIYQVSKATIYRWVKDDNIQFVRYNGKRHYDLDALQNAHDTRHSPFSMPTQTWVDGKVRKDYKSMRDTYIKWLKTGNNFEVARQLLANRNIRLERLKLVPRDKSTVAEVLDKYGSICYLCAELIDLEAPRSPAQPGWERGLQIDHVIPISKGGHDTIDNLRPTHGKCNLSKKDKLI